MNTYHKNRSVRHALRLAFLAGLTALFGAPDALEAAGNAGQPNICSRSCWSARSAEYRNDMPSLNRAMIHHTAGTYMGTSLEDSKAQMRAIQNYHMDNNGWADIGYGFVADNLGNIFEGMRDSIVRIPRGIHDGVNDRSMGFCLMGYFQSPYNQHPQTAGRNAIYDVIAWKMPNGWVGPYGSGTYNNRTVGWVDGHRNAKGTTSCPGDIFFNNYITNNYSGEEARNSINARIQGNDRLDVVVRGGSNKIYWKRFWRNNGGWSGWSDLGGWANEKPGISSRGPGQLEVFMRGGADDINFRSMKNYGTWSAWQGLGGPLASGIGGVSRSPDHINLVARGTNNEVQHKMWTPSGWSSFQSLGGWTAHTPSISARDVHHLDVFIRGGAGDLNWRAWNATNGWAAWAGLGGNLASGPSAVSRSSNRINVVAREAGKTSVMQIWYANGSWGGWQDLGGGTYHDPGIASWGPDRFDVFITGGGGDVNHKYYSNGSWSGWGTLGGSVTSGPEAVGGQW